MLNDDVHSGRAVDAEPKVIIFCMVHSHAPYILIFSVLASS